MSPEPSFWPMHPIGGSLRPSSGRSSTDTQWGLTMRGPRGLLLLKERHTGRGRAGRPLLGWNCGHQHERQVCSQMSGETGACRPHAPVTALSAQCAWNCR